MRELILDLLERIEIPGRDRITDKLLSGRDPFVRSCDGVRMLIDPADRIQRRFAIRSYERPLLRYMARTLRPGDAVIDGGAHVGYIALHAARAVAPDGLVLAVEPDPSNLASLRRNLDLNQLPVMIVEAALSDSSGTASFVRNLTPGETGWGSMLADSDDRSEEIEVGTVRIDDLAEQLGDRRLALIKLDVQGAEFAALSGASAALVEHRPVIVVETVDVWWGSRQTRTVADVRRLLSEAGYRERALTRTGSLTSPHPGSATGIFEPA